MQRYAIILAAEEYKHFPDSPTPFCHADAEILKSTLIDYCDYADQNIFLRLLNPTDGFSPSDVIEQINTIARKTLPGDTMLFYYAGHGTVDSNEPYLVLPCTEQYSIVQSALPLRAISEALRNPDRVNVRIFDACNSGFDVRNSAMKEFDAKGFIERVINEHQPEGWITLASCKADQASYSVTELRNGLFTKALCDSIKEFDVDSFIYPETLKVKVCEKMDRFCEKYNKTQTPTYNASVSGNVTIAKRRKLKRESDNPVTQRDLQSKLEKLRGIIGTSKDSKVSFLKTLITKIQESLASNMELFSSYGAVPKISKPSYNGEIHEDLRGPIVQFFNRFGFQSSHHLEVLYKEEKDSFLLGNPLPSFSKKISGFRLHQNHDWPASCVQLETTSDGVVPPCLIVIYLVPLQTKVFCILAISSGKERTYPTTGIEWLDVELSKFFLEYDELEFRRLDVEIKKLASSFKCYLEKVLTARINYLEKESSAQ